VVDTAVEAAAVVVADATKDERDGPRYGAAHFRFMILLRVGPIAGQARRLHIRRDQLDIIAGLALSRSVNRLHHVGKYVGMAVAGGGAHHA
jgi:hypothetical protein